MIVEIGAFSLALALALSVAQALVGGLARWRRSPVMAGAAQGAAIGAFVALLVAFAALMYAFVTSDFSVANVAANSHTAKPLLYRVAGTWGSHEGSMLLWVLILAGWSALAGWWIGRVDSKTIAAGAGPTSAEGQLGHESVYAARVLGFLGLVSLAMLSFTAASASGSPPS